MTAKASCSTCHDQGEVFLDGFWFPCRSCRKGNQVARLYRLSVRPIRELIDNRDGRVPQRSR